MARKYAALTKYFHAEAVLSGSGDQAVDVHLDSNTFLSSNAQKAAETPGRYKFVVIGEGMRDFTAEWVVLLVERESLSFYARIGLATIEVGMIDVKDENICLV